MKYDPTPDAPKPLAAVRAGATSDARWRDVPISSLSEQFPDATEIRVDSVRRHELHLAGKWRRA